MKQDNWQQTNSAKGEWRRVSSGRVQKLTTNFVHISIQATLASRYVLSLHTDCRRARAMIRPIPSQELLSVLLRTTIKS